MTDERELIEAFLAAPPFAVVGASSDTSKYGYKVLAAYLDRGLEAYPVNPKGGEILGRASYTSLLDLPEPVKSVSVITPPHVTERVVEDAHRAGAEILWFQPGAESDAAVARATELGMQVIHGGACVLVALSLR